MIYLYSLKAKRSAPGKTGLKLIVSMTMRSPGFTQDIKYYPAWDRKSNSTHPCVGAHPGFSSLG